jgi:hypothetical protein
MHVHSGTGSNEIKKQKADTEKTTARKRNFTKTF